MARIVCVGLACLDYLFKVADLPAGGGKFFAENYVAAPGGPAA
ncbi:MAG: ribokinase, partial [Desulfobulbaceae bacterium]